MSLSSPVVVLVALEDEVRVTGDSGVKPRITIAAPLEVGSSHSWTPVAISGPTRIVADHLGDVWGAAKPFHTSYAGEPAKFSIGVGRAVPCWDKGPDGVRAGSRVLLVCPPASAYGRTAQPGIPARSTLVFVIDVLGVG